MTGRVLPRQVAASLRALSTEIDRLDQAAADRYGLNRTDMRALDIVGQAGPLAPTALARLLGFTTGGVTSVLDRLERAGYIRRQVVHATEATAARDQEVFGDLIHRTSNLLAAYTDDQLQVIGDFLDRTRQLTAAYADALTRHPAASAPAAPASGR